MARSSLLHRFLALSSDTRARVFGMALAVSAVCALVVSAAYVTLSPRIDANLAAERSARLDAMIANLPGLQDLLLDAGADNLESVIVDLRTGLAAVNPPDVLDSEALIASPETSTELSPVDDLAGLKRRPDFAEIFLLSSGRELVLAIFPVYGQGYQSTIKAYVALEGDLNTIAGFTVTEQGETPGLGSKITDLTWLSKWPGKALLDEAGALKIAVVRGQAQTDYEIDGITGATRTGNGVSAMMQFWFGPNGFGPVIDALKAGELR